MIGPDSARSLIEKTPVGSAGPGPLPAWQPDEAIGIGEVAPGVPTDGPVPELESEVKELQRLRFARGASSG